MYSIQFSITIIKAIKDNAAAAGEGGMLVILLWGGFVHCGTRMWCYRWGVKIMWSLISAPQPPYPLLLVSKVLSGYLFTLDRRNSLDRRRFCQFWNS